MSYLVILIPFIIINGVLTGSIIGEPIVWYNNAENLGIRFFTIPVEDFLYYFLMFEICYLAYEQIKKATQKYSL
jgi:lycopene cyclase domain-containing protein